jgi:hypothetical protein
MRSRSLTYATTSRVAFRSAITAIPLGRACLVGTGPATVDTVAKAKPPPRSSTEIRTLLLRYFYDRNQKATSARGTKGVAAKISTVRSDLKALYGLAQQEVWSNLTYLLSQGWVEEDAVKKEVPLPTGTVIPKTTSYYKITAAGIDKIEGPGEFTMDRFKGIRIEATGQNIITVGDGNQVNARHEVAAAALAELKKDLVSSQDVSEDDKVAVVAEIDSIQAQLAKPVPNRTIVEAAWDGVKNIATGAGLVSHLGNIGKLLGLLP